MGNKLTEKQNYILELLSRKIKLSDSISDYESYTYVWFDALELFQDLYNDLDHNMLTEKQKYIIEKIIFHIFTEEDKELKIDEVELWYEAIDFVKDLLDDFNIK